MLFLCSAEGRSFVPAFQSACKKNLSPALTAFPRLPPKHWACSRSDIDWKAEGIRSSALEFVAYSLGFFHDGHRAASDCRATLHALA
jgi:hypothetical protein